MFRSPVVDGIVILIIALLILGPKRLPGLGKGLGVGMREFKEGITGESKDDETPEIPQSQSSTVPGGQDRPAQPAASSQATDTGSEHRS